MITPIHIFTANLGDSRTLLIKQGTFRNPMSVENWRLCFRNTMKVPLPPRIPSVILEEFEEDTIQELADTMEPGVVFSTEDHT